MSPEGQSFYLRLEPSAHQIRLTSEDVIADLLTNSHLARRNRDLLDYTEFAARRFDFVGQKAIYTKYITDLYAQAQARSSDRNAARHNLDRINDGNSLIQDMRGQTYILRDMYQKLWLGENRPYYLENILARYEEEERRWEGVSNRINQLRRIYDQHALPPLIAPGDPSEK